MTAGFVRTGTILDEILEHKAREVKHRQQQVDLRQVMEAASFVAPPRDFRSALHRDAVALIAEVKHASPSKGVLIDPFDPKGLGSAYAANGAAAISVLTDEKFFQGHLEHLSLVRNTVNIPVLRKDFVIDPYQVYQGRAAGADAILLIVAALDDTSLRDLRTLITGLNMAALIEVHDEAELERALNIGADLIGINNRSLKTFEVSLGVTERLAALVPKDVTLVAESGIHSVADVQRMGTLGAHAVLVGEALVTANDARTDRVREFSSQPRSKPNS